MQIRVLVDAEEFWPGLQRDIRAARDSIYIQSLSFEGDRVGKAVAQELVDADVPDRRVIADHFYCEHRINDKFLHSLRNRFDRNIRRERDETRRMMRDLDRRGVKVKLTNPSGPFLLKAFARNHKKIITIDDRIAYIGGMNFSEHNFEWHDMMVRVEDGDVARFLKDDFLSTWRGEHRVDVKSFEDVEIHVLDATSDRTSFDPIFGLIENATNSIVIESPYITYPFYEKIATAMQNGATVTLITPEHNNWRILKEYSLWQSKRSGIDVRLFQDRMMHLKAMLIDDKYLIVGSSNFDFLSVHFLQEIVAVITSKTVIAEFKKRILDHDIERSIPPRKTVSNLKGHYHQARLKFLNWLFNSLGKFLTYGR